MKKKGIVWFIIIYSSFFIFTSCEDPQERFGSDGSPIEPLPAPYQVTFYGNGGTPLFIFTEADEGERLIAPEEPVREDYFFAGWFTELELEDAVLWDFDDPVDAHMHLYAQWLPIITDVLLIRPYLNEFPENLTATGHPLILNVDLGTTAFEYSGWYNVLQEISAADKYVHLDLSRCSMHGSEFDAGAGFSVGKINIASLLLPDAARTVSGFGSSTEDHRYFANIASVGGSGITSISDNAFFGCDNLILLDFPQARSIGDSAFSGCSSLVSLSFPETSSIGNNAFDGSANLVSVNFPKLRNIGNNAFDGCDNFGRIVIAANSSISQRQEPGSRFDTFRDYYRSAGSIMGAYAWNRSVGWAGP